MTRRHQARDCDKFGKRWKTGLQERDKKNKGAVLPSYVEETHGGSAHPGQDMEPCTPSISDTCKVHTRSSSRMPSRVEEEPSSRSVATGLDQSHAVATCRPAQKDESLWSSWGSKSTVGQWQIAMHKCHAAVRQGSARYMGSYGTCTDGRLARSAC
jgi:hypothetical protein